METNVRSSSYTAERVSRVCYSTSTVHTATPLSYTDTMDFSRSRTYKEVRNHVDQLKASVTKRRKAAESLITLLGNPDIRRRLAQEGRSNPKAAVAETWRLVIRGILEATHMTVDSGKTKLTEADIFAPYKLLTLCDAPDDLFGDDETKLSKVETKDIFRFCFDMLDDERVLDCAEEVLLQMLSHLSSRVEYVAYFKPSIIRDILDEVKGRIVQGNSEVGVEVPILRESAKLFCNLINTTQKLGISLHPVLRYCIEMVSLYCNENRENDDVLEELPFVISGVTILLRSDPELAIGPLTDHGRPIFKFVSSKLINTKNESKLQATLSDYLLSHL